MYLLLPVIFLFVLLVFPLKMKVKLSFYLEYKNNEISLKSLKENYILLKLFSCIPVFKKKIFLSKKSSKKNNKKTGIRKYLRLVKNFRVVKLDCILGFNVYDYIYNSYFMAFFNMLLPSVINIFSTNVQNIQYKTVISNEPFYLDIDSTFSVYIFKLFLEYLKNKKKLYKS